MQRDFANPATYTEMEGTARTRKGRPSVEIEANYRHLPRRVSEAMALPLPEEVREVTDVVQAIRDIRRAVLLGDPGSGKSTTLRKMEVDFAELAQRDPAAPDPALRAIG